jgi:hypothetical protein
MTCLSEDAIRALQALLLGWLISAGGFAAVMVLIIQVVFPEIEIWIDGME